jgi:hypothetical protein
MKTNEFTTSRIYKNACMVVKKLRLIAYSKPANSSLIRVLEQHSTTQFRLVSYISTTTQIGCHRFIFCGKRNY